MKKKLGFYLSVFLLFFSACGSSSSQEKFYEKNPWIINPPSYPDMFIGIGKGDDPKKAVEVAKSDICTSIKSKIKANIKFKETQKVSGENIQYAENINRVINISGTCFFEDLEFKILKHGFDGKKHWILLGLPKRDYFNSLMKKQVLIKINGEKAYFDESHLGKFFVDKLYKLGYFPVENKEKAPNVLEVNLSAKYKNITIGDLKMIGAELTVFAKLYETSTKKIIKQWNLGRFNARAFTKEKVRAIFIKKINERLNQL